MTRCFKEFIDFMLVEDKLKPVDLLIVPGTSQTKAIDVAHELLKSGMSDKLLISGGVSNRLNHNTEADFLANYAISIGIKED